MTISEHLLADHWFIIELAPNRVFRLIVNAVSRGMTKNCNFIPFAKANQLLGVTVDSNIGINPDTPFRIDEQMGEYLVDLGVPHESDHRQKRPVYRRAICFCRLRWLCRREPSKIVPFPPTPQRWLRVILVSRQKAGECRYWSATHRTPVGCWQLLGAVGNDSTSIQMACNATILPNRDSSAMDSSL